MSLLNNVASFFNHNVVKKVTDFSIYGVQSAYWGLAAYYIAAEKEYPLEAQEGILHWLTVALGVYTAQEGLKSLANDKGKQDWYAHVSHLPGFLLGNALYIQGLKENHYDMANFGHLAYMLGYTLWGVSASRAESTGKLDEVLKWLTMAGCSTATVALAFLTVPDLGNEDVQITAATFSGLTAAAFAPAIINSGYELAMSIKEQLNKEPRIEVDTERQQRRSGNMSMSQV